MKYKKVNILGITYDIIYCDKAIEVDSDKKDEIWGQISYNNRTIRVYDSGGDITSIMGTLLHEIIHAISQTLHIEELDPDKNNNAEKNIDILSVALSDMLTRNGWLK